jgi:hypothetical protein
MLDAGYPLSQVTQALCARWQPGRAAAADERRPRRDPRARRTEGGERVIHFQEWWVRHRAALPASAIVAIGAEQAAPAPGVLEAIGAADVVVLPPSNPVVSIGTVLQVPGIAEALRAKTVVGVSPDRRRRPVRGHGRRLPDGDRRRDERRGGRAPLRRPQRGRAARRLARRHGGRRRDGARASRCAPSRCSCATSTRPPPWRGRRWTWPVPSRFEVLGVAGLPEVRPGDDVAALSPARASCRTATSSS